VAVGGLTVEAGAPPGCAARDERGAMSQGSRTAVPDAQRAAAPPEAAVAVRRGSLAPAVVILVLTQLNGLGPTLLAPAAFPPLAGLLLFGTRTRRIPVPDTTPA
jgi:hypothetical protein